MPTMVPGWRTPASAAGRAPQPQEALKGFPAGWRGKLRPGVARVLDWRGGEQMSSITVHEIGADRTRMAGAICATFSHPAAAVLVGAGDAPSRPTALLNRVTGPGNRVIGPRNRVIPGASTRFHALRGPHSNRKIDPMTRFPCGREKIEPRSASPVAPPALRGASKTCTFT
jgi:hypothetical protein